MQAPAGMLPSADPRAGYLAHQQAIDQAVREVLHEGNYILGKQVQQFETEFAHYLGTGRVIGVGSGTDALHLALRACGIGPGDDVLTVSHTAVATVAAITLAGANPVFVDIDPNTYVMDADQVEKALRRYAGPGRPRAILPVHLYGQLVDMPALLDLARRHDLSVIEDCAQAHGARLHGRLAGTWGHLAAFSFYPTKNLGCLGDGGAIATSDPKLADRVLLLREYGWRERYISVEPGFNSRLDEIQAAVLRVKLRHLDAENLQRQELAGLYKQGLEGLDLVPPAVAPGATHVYHLFVIRTGLRDDLRTFLRTHSVGTAVHYPVPIHLQPAYHHLATDSGPLPVTERICQDIVSLPLYPQLRREQVEGVVELIRKWKP